MRASENLSEIPPLVAVSIELNQLDVRYVTRRTRLNPKIFHTHPAIAVDPFRPAVPLETTRLECQWQASYVINYSNTAFSGLLYPKRISSFAQFELETNPQ